MTTPTDAATLIAKYNGIWEPTAEQVTDWVTVTRGGDTTITNDKAVIKVGLFGAELDDFNEDCAALEDKCKEADYEDYSGWALGVSFAPSAAMTEGEDSIVIFEESKNVVWKEWNAASSTSAARLLFGKSTVAVTATAPLLTEIGTLTAATNGFPDDSWGGKPTVGLSAATFAYTFQAADEGYELGDKIKVWNAPSTTGLFDDSAAATAAAATTKYVMTEVELKSAISLTATVASVIVASLLF
jgi:hypothetical protein